VNPFPLVEVAIPLPKRGKSIRQALKIRSLLGISFSSVLVGLVGGKSLVHVAGRDDPVRGRHQR
jgi:hypothetical protein